MKTAGGVFRRIARALELDRLFDGETGFFVRGGSAPPAAAAGQPASAPPLSSEVPEGPPAIAIRVGPPFISPSVSPLAGEPARAGSRYATSFVASWRPVPKPADQWIRFLLDAPFGTQNVSAKDLHWNGREISIERVTENEIEAFVAKMEEWAEYANREFASWQTTPEVRARFEASNRARQLQDRLRR